MQMNIGVRSASAISGLILVLFLLVHLAGLVPALVATEQFENYASALHHSSWLALIEVGLAATAVAHIMLTLAKTIRNLHAGNAAALRSRRNQPLSTFASGNKVLAGMITLGFLALHLQQLRWPRPADGMELNQLNGVLHQPLMLAIYAGASLAIGLHLLHGAEAAHRSMGWLTPANGQMLRLGGRFLAAVISAGFLMISLGVALGDAT